MENGTCSRCNEDLPVNVDSFTTGYGVDLDDNKVCYACCAEEDKKWMEEHDKITLYLAHKSYPNDTYATDMGNGTSYPWTVSNWPGSLRFSAVVVKGGHNWGLERRDAWFTDHTGRKWWGVSIGDMTDLVHCRKLKA